ncbi:hypothetical protein [Maribacter sp.]|uniref:hypothetical protein n=1 Tax=Maribacter sp. TaxID=1897614 RepID=UPI0025BAFCAB|nr:hypothetical protein [Maribacter sp.]
MIELQKEDIPILDFIINELQDICLHSLNREYLGEKKVFNFGKTETIGDFAFNESDMKEFERLVSIIEKYDCAKVNPVGFESPLSVSKNSKTLQFIKQGGFRKLYENLEKEKERENIEFKLAESNIKANELNEKNSKRNLFFAILNIVIGIINIYILVRTLK